MTQDVTATTNLSAKALGDIIGLTSRRIHQLANSGMPWTGTEKRKLFNLQTSIQWYISHIKVSKESQSYEEERTRLVKAQADKTELETQIRRGEVLELETVEQCMMALAAEYSSQMDSISGRMANELAAESDVSKIQILLHDQIRGVTNVITDRLAAIADYKEDGGDTETTTEKDGSGVG